MQRTEPALEPTATEQLRSPSCQNCCSEGVPRLFVVCYEWARGNSSPSSLLGQLVALRFGGP
jgi:hypothetical protein